jgi:hypothetical protein
MATASPMTWNLNWKLVGTGVAALAGVLGLGSPLHLASPVASPQTTRAPRTEVAAVSALQEQTRRLDQRLEAVQAAPPSRNLFRFGARPVARRAVALAPVVAPAPIAPPPAPFPLRLSGIAVDVVNGVQKRTAILSGPSGVELAASGDPASPGYRVVEVGESFAEVERTSDGTRERLTLARPSLVPGP